MALLASACGDRCRLNARTSSPVLQKIEPDEFRRLLADHQVEIRRGLDGARRKTARPSSTSSRCPVNTIAVRRHRQRLGASLEPTSSFFAANASAIGWP